MKRFITLIQGALMVCLFINLGFSQVTIKGVVTDADGGETLIGANVYIENTVKGTITDFDGNYEITIDELPSTVVFSLIGYERKSIVVDGSTDTYNIVLGSEAIMADVVVVSASRVEESILESPVTVEKLDLIAIKQSASADYYDEITRLKGVSHTQASLTFNSINARGFAGHGNTRFVQLQDGMDNAAPLLNFPTGNIVGISELDIKNVELIPGAASALYGPNAFNGILLMESKDPFKYQGLSAQIKSGITQSDFSTDPFYGASVRYAKAFNDKFAFKLNLSTLFATDWAASDYTTQRSPSILGNKTTADFDFDGINTYGDEIAFDITGTNGQAVTFTRPGIPEEVLLDNRNAESLKADFALHYKISDKVETNVSYKWGSGATVYQGSERYALRNFTQQFAKWELNGDKWNIRAYTSQTNAGDSYNMTALGTFANLPANQAATADFSYNGMDFSLPITTGWAVAVNLAMNGALQSLEGISPNDPASAIAYANLGGTSSLSELQMDLLSNGLGAQFLSNGTIRGSMALSGNPIFEGMSEDELNAIASGIAADFGRAIAQGAAVTPLYDNSSDASKGIYSEKLLSEIERVRDGLFQKGGASFIDNSGMYHVEGNYDLSDLTNNVIGLQAGANWRLYSLWTDGTIFDEPIISDGFDANGNELFAYDRININEFGGYLQASKRLANDKLKLSASIRYDKNQNFEGQFSPRLSMVYSLDENKRHNIRTSFQTGFRNPTTQGQYIYFPTSSILLGGSKDNAEKYGLYEGGAWSQTSYERFRQTGDEADLRVIDLDYVQPEQIRSFELGYKGISNKKLFLDVSGYYSIYDNFIQQDNVVLINPTTHDRIINGVKTTVQLPTGTVFRPYFNAPVEISSYGINAGAEYILSKNWKVSGNFTYNDYSIDEDNLPPGYEDFDPGFNTPLTKFNFGISNRKFLEIMGFGVNFRWQDEFFWFGSFGSGIVPSYYTLDAQVSVNLRQMNSTLKLGVNNLVGTNYVTNYGGPSIGRMVHLTITYDQFAN